MTGDGAEAGATVPSEAERRSMVSLAVAKFDDPRLGLLATREELTSWAEAGLRGDPPIGCDAAIRRMIPIKHRGLAKSLALRAAYGRGLRRGTADREDLVAAGFLGLLIAASKFDVERRFRFSTYATYHVRNEIAKAVRAGGPEHHGEVWLEGVGVDLRTGRAGDDGGPEVGRPRPDPKVVAVLLRSIPGERDRLIVMERFGAGEGGSAITFEGIGAKHGVSKERVRQIMKECMRRMRAAAEHRGITIERCFLGCDAHVA